MIATGMSYSVFLLFYFYFCFICFTMIVSTVIQNSLDVVLAIILCMLD